jgi:hypothetical protein
MSFHHILVPVSLSERTEVAIEAVPRLAAPGARVELFHVVARVADTDDPALEPFYAAMAERAGARLDAWCARLRDASLAASREVRIGKPGRLIMERIREVRCELVVMVSHVVTGPDGRVGTLSHQIAMLSPAPVLLLR